MVFMKGAPKRDLITAAMRKSGTEPRYNPSKLEGTAEEQQIVGRLLEILQKRGGEYADFGENVKGFLYNMQQLGKNGQDSNQLAPFLKATCSYVGILAMQNNNPRDELINATMSYLNAKYPKNTEK